MSQRITIQIENKIATCLTELPVVCGNSDYECEFLFDEEWNDHNIKTARFKTSAGYTDVVFEGNICPMPIISNSKIVWIGVFAGELSTSTPAIVKCRASILDGEDVPAPPREDVYSQIVELCESAVETAEDVKKRADNGEFNGKDGADGKDGKDGADGNNGFDGKSAYEIALEHGFEGTEEEWLDSLKAESALPKHTEGLEYTLSNDGLYYICTGLGTATDKDIIIASEYEGKPVKIIGHGAFSNKANLNSIVIPSSVIAIQYDAFGECDVHYVYIPKSVTTIDSMICDGASADMVGRFYCEADFKPSGWDNDWNWNRNNEAPLPVTWGYKSDIRGLNDALNEKVNRLEVEEMIGDISSALDEIHTYAQSLVNGGNA